MTKAIASLVLSIVFSSAAFAGDCVLKIDRKACPGKETDALKPYNGKNPTEEKKSADSVEKCTKIAEDAAKIVRKGTLSDKTVTASFDGKDLGKPFTGTSACK